jgi:adenosylcobinamide-GDP ribazoletransferase
VGLSDAGPLAALRGALGFLTRLPVGHDAAAWEAFRRSLWTMPAAGVAVGLLVAAPVALALPPATAAAAALVVCYGATGITHLDGLADCGDAAVVHGDAADRRAVLSDAELGVGGTAALAVAVAALALGLTAVAALPAVAAVALVVAAEVAAKTGIALLAALGSPAHEGLGERVVGPSGPVTGAAALVVALALLAGTLAVAWRLGIAPRPLAVALGAVLTGAVLAAAVVGRWGHTRLGGVSGDALGASNELGRAAALHAGVVAWTLS